jgi:hypothetical protein
MISAHYVEFITPPSRNLVRANSIRSTALRRVDNLHIRYLQNVHNGALSILGQLHNEITTVEYGVF